MTRPLRIEYPGAWYHVMNRGRRKEKVFFQERDYALFLEVVEQAIDIFDIEIYSYALLPNHYHLLIRTPKGNLSRSMRYINGVYTQRLNKRHKLDGSLFRGRYKSILIEEEAYLLELVRYIHRNPLKAKLENQLGEYEWCSHRAYLKKKEKKEWLKTKEVLSKFSKYDKEALRELKSFVEKEVPKNILKRLESVNWPAIMGREEFKNKIKKYIKGKEIQMEEIPGYNRELFDVRKKQEEK